MYLNPAMIIINTATAPTIHENTLSMFLIRVLRLLAAAVPEHELESLPPIFPCVPAQALLLKLC